MKYLHNTHELLYISNKSIKRILQLKLILRSGAQKKTLYISSIVLIIALNLALPQFRNSKTSLPNCFSTNQH